MILVTHNKPYGGFSLIELLVSMSILAILSSIAVPNLQKYIHKSQLDTTRYSLRSVLSLARQTAISTGYDTYICELKKNDCNPKRPFNANWSNGWIAFIDINNNQELDLNDDIIQMQQQKKDIAIIFNQRGRLRFRSNGSARSAGFYLCNHTHANHILILYSGRTRSKTLTKPSNIEKCRKALEAL